MTRTAIEFILAVAIPLAGAMGYVHGNFATKEAVKETKLQVTNAGFQVDKIYTLICKMAIRQNIETAEDICTSRTIGE